MAGTGSDELGAAQSALIAPRGLQQQRQVLPRLCLHRYGTT